MLGNKRIMGENIQHYMDKLGIERREFAKAIGVPYSSLTDWINGNSYPRIDKIQKMADYFQIEKADLVEDRATRHAGLSPELVELLEAAAGCTPEQIRTAIILLNTLKANN